MAKRGPAPKGEYEGKSNVLSTRIRPDTRQALAMAAKGSGRSLSQEIEHRLRRSFDDDHLAKETFGSRRNRALMKILALSMQTAFNPKNPEADWMDDPILYEKVHRAINRILDGYRPSGPIPTLDAFEELHAIDGPSKAMHRIQNADETLPIDVTSGDHLANLIKSDLGAVATRPKFFEGNAEELRAHATSLQGTEDIDPERRQIGADKKSKKRMRR